VRHCFVCAFVGGSEGWNKKKAFMLHDGNAANPSLIRNHNPIHNHATVRDPNLISNTNPKGWNKEEAFIQRDANQFMRTLLGSLETAIAVGHGVTGHKVDPDNQLVCVPLYVRACTCVCIYACARACVCGACACVHAFIFTCIHIWGERQRQRHRQRVFDCIKC